MSAVTLFEEKQVRRAWNQTEGKWYFAIVDVIDILTESVDASAYCPLASTHGASSSATRARDWRSLKSILNP